MTSKTNISLYFQDTDGQERFLVQVVNFGKKTDEIKFTFTDITAGIGGFYTETLGHYTGEEILRVHPEITYHSDGSLLQKLPSYSARTETVYKNPDGQGTRRTPLAHIRRWNAFMRYTVVNYDICIRRSSSHKKILPSNRFLFDGTPFQVVFLLGHATNRTPWARPWELVFRLIHIGTDLDLLLYIMRSPYYGQYHQITHTDMYVWSRSNIIDILKDNTG